MLKIFSLDQSKIIDPLRYYTTILDVSAPFGFPFRNVQMGVWGASHPQYFQICKKLGQSLARQQEGWQQYFL